MAGRPERTLNSPWPRSPRSSRRRKDELRSARRELDIAKLQAATYLEHLAHARVAARDLIGWTANLTAGRCRRSAINCERERSSSKPSWQRGDEAIAKLKTAAHG